MGPPRSGNGSCHGSGPGWKWTRVPPPPEVVIMEVDQGTSPSGQTTHRPSVVGFPLKKGFLLVE